MFEKCRNCYPGVEEAELERCRSEQCEDEEPDFIGGAPNYDKFEGWTPEQVLVWLNID